MRTAREKARKRKEAEAKAAGQTASAVNGDANAPNAEEAGSKEEDGQGVKRKHDEVDPEEAPAQLEDASKPTDTTTAGAPAPIVDQQMEESESKPKVPSTPWTDPETNLANLVLSKPSAEMRGHTSYLTFACFYPASIRSQLAAQQDESTTASRATPQRVAESTNAEKAASALGKVTNREASQETDYGDDGLDGVVGSMTEEELMALSRR
jgi:tRNA (adenine57-N1/adenine58-N1)-methyltransferase